MSVTIPVIYTIIIFLYCRELKVAIDELLLETSWSKDGISQACIPVTLSSLQLEGAVFDGISLQPCAANSPSVTTAPACIVAWVPKVCQ